jgi:hypothetical protein
MEIEDIVGVKFSIENEVDVEEKDRGWDLEDIAGDSLNVGEGEMISSGWFWILYESAVYIAFHPKEKGVYCIAPKISESCLRE